MLLPPRYALAYVKVKSFSPPTPALFPVANVKLVFAAFPLEGDEYKQEVLLPDEGQSFSARSLTFPAVASSFFVQFFFSLRHLATSIDFLMEEAIVHICQFCPFLQKLSFFSIENGGVFSAFFRRQLGARSAICEAFRPTLTTERGRTGGRLRVNANSH